MTKEMKHLIGKWTIEAGKSLTFGVISIPFGIIYRVSDAVRDVTLTVGEKLAFNASDHAGKMRDVFDELTKL